MKTPTPKFFTFLAALMLLFTFIRLPTSFAEQSERDLLIDDIEAISATIDSMNLDDRILLKNNKTLKVYIGEILKKVHDDAEKPESVISNEQVRKEIQDLKLALVYPQSFKDIADVPTADVPTGEIFADLLPQLIALGFKVAWVAIFLSFVVSGVYMILSLDNEDRVTNAKHIFYYSLIGFAVITLAFALVKAITSINFFPSP